MNRPSVLIIADSLDFASDYVSLSLERNRTNYLRLNRDQLSNYSISLRIDPQPELLVSIGGQSSIVSPEELVSVYYRAPVALRDIYQRDMDLNAQLGRTQWMSFVKNLMVFDRALWINHPAKTFVAENKLLQLVAAKEIGFDIPSTVATNDAHEHHIKVEQLAVKSLDVIFLSDHNSEYFLYTSQLNSSKLSGEDLHVAPLIVQESLEPKVDVRVTIVGDDVFAARIVINGTGVSGDWRLMKNRVDYESVTLPPDVAEKCTKLSKWFGLTFAAIDLALCRGTYYFLEVNPTGEWAWLLDTCGFPIDTCLAKALSTARVK